MSDASVLERASAIDALFHGMTQAGASDLHLCVGMPPLVRKDGRMQPLDAASPALTDEMLRRLLEPITPAANRKEFIDTPRYGLRLRDPGARAVPRQPLRGSQRAAAPSSA